MELYNLPVVQRWLQGQTDASKAVALFVKLTKQDSVKAANVMSCLATAINSLAGKIGVTEDNEQKEKLAELRSKLGHLATQFNQAALHTDYRFPSLVYAVKIAKELGTSRNLGRLRRVIGDFSYGLDDDHCFNWLQQQVEIEECDDCNQWEYSSKIAKTYHDESVCRECISESYRWSDYYNLHVYSDRSREARNADGNWVIIDEDDDNFTYNDFHDYWHHHNYEPPPPPIIANYHSSKPLQRVIVDEWSKIKHRWFGAELEVEIKDNAIDRQDKARHLNEIINGGEVGKKVFFENDGSLNSGFEIVTQPMSLPAHRDLWQWLRDRDAARNLLSHNTRTCGLHVHVNKDNLTQIQIAKIVTFINDPNNEQMIRAIARRYAEGYCKIKPKDLLTAHQSSDRYEAVNITPRNTIEFRIFKGSLKYESVVAAIEFCNALTDFCSLPVTNDAKSLTSDNFIDYVNDQGSAETNVLRPYMNAVLQTA